MGDGTLSSSKSSPCAFCGRTDDCPEKYGEKKTYPEHNLTLHYYCLLLSSGIYSRGEEDEGIYGFLVEDINKEVCRSRRMSCSICKKKGASIGCVGHRCKRSYHYPCGVDRECIFQFMDSFASYCWKHRPVQKCGRSSGSSTCTICLDFVPHLPSYHILNSPCCKTAWFHRDCLQYQALSAGVFFFRCTVCNNKDLFQKEMLRLGIHIPEKDASWELEENAYEELLQRYQHCDAQKCLCKNGREYDESESKWEIVRCQCCGSRGTHLACSSMHAWEQSWECSDCKNIINRSVKRRRSGSLATPERIEMMDRSLDHSSPKCSRLSTGSHRKILLRASQPKSDNEIDSPSSGYVQKIYWIPRPYSRQWRTIADILRELELQVDKECSTALVINPADIWSSALSGFRHRNFSPTKTIKVNFIGQKPQADIDEVHGCRREFFRLLMRCLQNSPIFVGASSKNLTYDFKALQENLYYEAGRMIAVSIVHGGPSPNFFSKTLFYCLVHGPGNVEPSIEDVADEDMLQLIQKVKSSKSVLKLRTTIQESYDYLCDIGCLSIIQSRRDQDKLIKDLLIYQVIRRVQKPFESFRHGLKTLGVLEKIRTFPDVFWYILCQRPEKLTAIKLGNLFTIRFSTEDTGRLVPETKITEFWMDYLEDVEDGECRVSLEEILTFVTGADTVPPLGYNPEPSVIFHSGDVPVGHRYTNCLELPTANSYGEFKNKMDLTISRLQSSPPETVAFSSCGGQTSGANS